jgi:hypothetical protein
MMDQGNDDLNAGLTTEERRARWFQAVMDWWKTVYDFFKHLMTIALLAIGTVGALVGGPFKNVVQLEKPQAPLLPIVLVGVMIVAFAIAAAVAVQGMHSARQKMLCMKDVRNQTDAGLKDLRDRKVGLLLEVSPKAVWVIVQWSYLVGVSAFIIFLLIAMF